MFQRDTTKKVRYYNSYISSLNVNYNLLINPWMPMLWSVMFPGFGHLLLGAYLDGYLLIIWEIVINNFSHLNQAILYTFHGKFELAKSTLAHKWAILYLPVYIYAMWDAYRTTVETNYLYVLAEKENANVTAMKLSSFSFNYLDKISPLMTVFWSFCMPGLGHVVMHRMPTGIFLFAWWLAICHYANMITALYFTMIGSFGQAIDVLQPQWLLFLPSLYGFAIYDSYVTSIELTKLYKIEKIQHFQSNFQSEAFPMPLKPN